MNDAKRHRPRCLIALSRDIGRPERELAILGEGNTSADAGDGTFWVKASGSQLALIDAAGFSQVRLAPMLELLDAPRLSDAQVAAGLRAALVDPAARKPSVETFMHALCLSRGPGRLGGALPSGRGQPRFCAAGWARSHSCGRSSRM